MTLSEWASVAEIIGAIAVLVTLIYLSLQIRQYNKGLRTSTFHTTMQEFNQINIIQLEPSLAGLFDKGLLDFDSLTELEKRQFGWIVRTYVNIWENMYQQYLEGACPESYWLPYAKQARSLFDTPAGKKYRKGNTLNKGLFLYLDGLEIESPNYDLSLK